MEKMELTIVTPERTFFTGETDFVEFTGADGRVGVYPGHEAMTIVLEPGVLHIHNGAEDRKAALHSGFAEILPDKIRILAQVAEWPEEIDKNRAEEARIRAERRIREDGSSIRDELALRRAIARIESTK